MSERPCASPLPLPELIAYWLGEMEEPSQAGLEEHLFGCADCNRRLARLVELGRTLGQALGAGVLSSVIPAPFLRRLTSAGMRVREYRVQQGGSVNCTIAPDDDFVVSHLEASLRDVRRLDLVFETEGTRHRYEDVAFDPATDEVIFAPSAAELRKLGVATARAQLIAVSPDAERVIGRYTFNHYPFTMRIT